MKIVCISDLHGQLPIVPECSILIISGDICPHFHSAYVGDSDDCFGQSKWLQGPFAAWLDAVPAKEKVIIFGNHDWVAEKHPQLVPNLNAHVLGFKNNSIITLDGLKIYGDPYSLYFHHWAFNSPPIEEGGEEFLDERYSKIPDDTDIVITHGPPFEIGDLTSKGNRTGSKALLKHLKRVKPKLCVFGHIHESYGQYEIDHGDKKTIAINASVLNRKYKLVNDPIIIDL